MTREEAKKTIMNTIVELTGTHEAITEESNIIRDLGVSSIQIMSMLGEMEEIFDVDLSVRKLRKIRTVGDLCEYIIKQSI